MISGINRVAVLGAGTMGPGIAFSYAQCGYQVALYTRSEATQARAREHVEQMFRIRVKNDLLTEEQAEEIRSRISFVLSLEEACADTQLIVETITENVEAKRTLYATIDEICPEDCIFTSGTSTLDVFSLMPERRRARAVIMHGFSPYEIIPLIEIVCGPDTTPEVVEIAKQLIDEMGKTYIVLDSYVFGFVVNRLQAAIFNEAVWLVDNGYATPQDVDLAVRSSIMPRASVLGLFQTRDFGGLDVGASLDDPNTPEAIKKLLRTGDLGVKTGKGFYDYSGRTIDEITEWRDKALMAMYEANKPFRQGAL